MISLCLSLLQSVGSVMSYTMRGDDTVRSGASVQDMRYYELDITLQRLLTMLI